MKRTLGVVLVSLGLGCKLGAVAGQEAAVETPWQQRAAAEAAALWSVSADSIEIEVYEAPAITGVVVFAAVVPDDDGVWWRHRPGVVVGTEIEWDPDRARGKALSAMGVGGATPPEPADAARVAARLLPSLAEPMKVITDPTRGAYYAEHFRIEGVAPPTLIDRTLQFWVSGSEQPVERVRVVLTQDGRATLEIEAP